MTTGHLVLQEVKNKIKMINRCYPILQDLRHFKTKTVIIAKCPSKVSKQNVQGDQGVQGV